MQATGPPKAPCCSLGASEHRSALTLLLCPYSACSLAYLLQHLPLPFDLGRCHLRALPARGFLHCRKPEIGLRNTRGIDSAAAEESQVRTQFSEFTKETKTANVTTNSLGHRGCHLPLYALSCPQAWEATEENTLGAGLLLGPFPMCESPPCRGRTASSQCSAWDRASPSSSSLSHRRRLAPRSPQHPLPMSKISLKTYPPPPLGSTVSFSLPIQLGLPSFPASPVNI